MNISYAWTTDALLARRKTCTRRDWSDDYAKRFPEGSIHNAYNRQARFGGKKVATVQIVLTPYPERSCDIPDEDFENEGFAYMEEKGLLIRGITPREFFDNWRESPQILYVVRFKLISTEGGKLWENHSALNRRPERTESRFSVARSRIADHSMRRNQGRRPRA